MKGNKRRRDESPAEKFLSRRRSSPPIRPRKRTVRPFSTATLILYLNFTLHKNVADESSFASQNSPAGAAVQSLPPPSRIKIPLGSKIDIFLLAPDRGVMSFEMIQKMIYLR